MLMYRICPIFAISCVSGRNLDLLLKFLNALPPVSNSSEKEKIVQAMTEHQASCALLPHSLLLALVSSKRLCVFSLRGAI